MNIKINETGKLETLEAIDRYKQVNWVKDLIGNAGGFDDGQFTWSAEDDAYLASQDTYDWWENYIQESYDTETDVIDLANQLEIDAEIIWDRIASLQGLDYERHRHEALAAMEEIRLEYEGEVDDGQLTGPSW